MKKNILIIVTSAIGGGVERLIFDQMRLYDQTKFNLHVLTLRKGYLEKEFSDTTAHYLCLDSKRRISVKAVRRLIRYIRENNIDLVHTHLFLPDIYGFIIKLLIRRIKLVTTKHNTNDFRKRLHWGLLDKLISLPANQIIAVSKSVKRFISRYEFIPSHKIKVIYHGVNIETFQKNKNLKGLKKELKISDKDFIIGIVGRLTKQKGHEYLLNAVAILKKKIKSVRLLIIGVGELKQELVQYSRELEISSIVQFLGFRQDTPALYSLMDVLCLPSLYEGLGLVLIEAMLCNTITVASKVDGIQEIISDGENGFLVPPKDSHKLASILLKIYRKEFIKGIRERARQTALRFFDYKKNLRKIEKLYCDLLYK